MNFSMKGPPSFNCPSAVRIIVACYLANRTVLQQRSIGRDGQKASFIISTLEMLACNAGQSRAEQTGDVCHTSKE